MPEGWSVRVDVNGVEWYSTDDPTRDANPRWYRWVSDYHQGTHREFGDPVFEEKADA